MRERLENGAEAPGEEARKKKSLQMSDARLQSGMIRNLIRGIGQPLPPVSEATGLTPTASVELPPSTNSPSTPKSLPHDDETAAAEILIRSSTESSSRAAGQRSNGGSAEGGSAANGRCDGRPSSFDSGARPATAERQSAGGAKALGNEDRNGGGGEVGWGDASQAAQRGSDGSQQWRSVRFMEAHQPLEHPWACHPQDSCKPHVLRSLMARVEGLLAAADEWGFDTLELSEVGALSCIKYKPFTLS